MYYDMHCIRIVLNHILHSQCIITTVWQCSGWDHTGTFLYGSRHTLKLSTKIDTLV